MPVTTNHASGVFFVRTIDVSLSVIDRKLCPGAMTGNGARECRVVAGILP